VGKIPLRLAKGGLARAALEALEGSWGGRTAVGPPVERETQNGLSEDFRRLQEARSPQE
jgi:hypothetical protein